MGDAISGIFGGSKPPPPPQSKPDPMYNILQNKASEDETNALKGIAAGDFASLLARYGSLLAFGGNRGVSPLLASPIVGKPMQTGTGTMK